MSTFSRMSCPTASVCPCCRKLRRRSSSGVSPTTAATRSRWRSSANTLCGAPKPRKAPCGGSVGRDHAAADAHVGALIGTGGMDRAARQHHRRERFVGPAIQGEIDIHGHQLAFARNAVRCRVRDGWRLVVADHIFGAVVNRSSPACRISRPATPRGPRSSRDILPCRRSRRRFPSAPRAPALLAAQRAAPGPCARNADTGATPRRSRPPPALARAIMLCGSR